jgi:hypothetical protein
MAEDAARELLNLLLQDALQLVHLYAERGSPKFRAGGEAVVCSLIDRGHAGLAGRGEGHGQSRHGRAPLSSWRL